MRVIQEFFTFEILQKMIVILKIKVKSLEEEILKVKIICK